MTEQTKKETTIPESQAENDDTKAYSDRGHGCLLTSLIALVMLPVLYFLSIGPVLVVFAKLYDVLPAWAEKTLMGVYFPIIWLAQNNETFGNIAGAYVGWWLNIFKVAFFN